MKKAAGGIFIGTSILLLVCILGIPFYDSQRLDPWWWFGVGPQKKQVSLNTSEGAVTLFYEARLSKTGAFTRAQVYSNEQLIHTALIAGANGGVVICNDIDDDGYEDIVKLSWDEDFNPSHAYSLAKKTTLAGADSHSRIMTLRSFFMPLSEWGFIVFWLSLIMFCVGYGLLSRRRPTGSEPHEPAKAH